MKHKETLSSKVRRAGLTIADAFRPMQLAKYIIGGSILFNLMSANGCFDSNRTKEALRFYENRQRNVTKTVSDVEEEFDPCYNSSTWINPRVTREVEFDDGTEITLSYRTHTWQPIRRWINGEEFSPKVGEKYEVTDHNQLVRKLEQDSR